MIPTDVPGWRRVLGRLPGHNPIAAMVILAIAANVVLSSLTTSGLSFLKGSESDEGGVALGAPIPVENGPPPLPPPHTVDREDLVTPTPPPTPPFISHAPASGSVAANELGRIPVLMYHAFVSDEAYIDEWTVTFDQFREQLDWLVANDFTMVGLNSVISRDFAVPAGRKPVVLTFDDASARQFRLQQAPDGGYQVHPDSAVAVLEEYRVTYPEFFGPAFFAVLPYNCFTMDDDPSTCEDRLTWLVEHGYEVGNHTMGHQNLTDVPIERFKEEILEPRAWFAERISGPNNLADVLVLPYGAYPANEDFATLLFDGFWHFGEYFVPSLVLEVGGGPTLSPFHVEWATNLWRYNTDPATFWYWADQIERGEMQVFVSDGDPTTVTVPAGWEDALHQERIQQDGRRIVILN